MKKIVQILLIFALLIPSLIVPDGIKAKTLRDLKNELAKTEAELKAQKDEEALTNKQIDQIKNNIASINVTIQQISADMIRLNNKIVQLQIDIVNKDKEIKEVINFIQLSNGESAYLEYAFGAQDFTDFIYRMAISEQMTNYNDQLIAEYNQMIEDNKNKQIELTNKDKELKNQQVDLGNQLVKVKSHLADIYDDFVDLEEAIKVQQEVVKMYEVDYKCKLDDDLTECARNALPSDTVFWRPTKTGSMSSNYGQRTYYINGAWKTSFHTGIDIALPATSPVYSIANGTVASITWKYYCGGNMVFIHHRVNGQTYTSIYMHLYSVNVKVGDMVDKNTIIGTSGGDRNYTPWDTCTTGAHLHLSLLYGKVGIDYGAWSSAFYNNLIDPRMKINFPGLGGYFSDRTTRY